MNFPEDFLHFIWQYRLYDHQNLYTLTGEKLKVFHQGTLNKNAGPDFSNAKISIGNTTWAGHIEIHISASDWIVHHHQKDSAYENVVLHVVYEADEQIFRKDGTFIPTLILKGLFDLELLKKYEGLITSVNSFPCEKQIGSVDSFIIDQFLSRILVERLAYKSAEVEEKVKALKGDWDETFYHFLAKSFGFKVNALPMEMLAKSLPQQLFAKHKDQPLQIEALIFGQAGFLSQNFADDYPKLLKKEYQFLRKKYNLQPLDVSLWKFLRMRPQNFPTLRLAQFAALIVKSNHLFSKTLSFEDDVFLPQLFKDLPVNSYWKKHYHFNKKAESVKLNLGKGSIDNLLINTLSLFLFAYGRVTNQPNYENRAFNLLENLAAENNAILKQFEIAGVKIENAFNSQALLQLKKYYCNEKKCLNCAIGIKILKQ